MLTTDIANDAGQESFSSTNTILAFGFKVVVQIYEKLIKESTFLFLSDFIYIYCYFIHPYIPINKTCQILYCCKVNYCVSFIDLK